MSSTNFNELTDAELRDAEQSLAKQKQEREHAKWDAELVGRYFRIIRSRDQGMFPSLKPFRPDDYVTLEESLAVGNEPNRYVFADIVFLHIKQRDDSKLTCSGFEVSHSRRDEPYLKIQPTFYSYSDFRNYLNSWNHHTGPTKHFDEISEDEYKNALTKVVLEFCGASHLKGDWKL